MRRFIIVVFAAFAVSCAHKAPAKDEAVAAAPPKSTPKAENKTDLASSTIKRCTADADCSGSEICDQNQCVAGSKDCNLIRVHFSFDSSKISDEDRTDLERSARCLRAHQRVKMTIEGNADERGTVEYNLALGERRAVAVAKYLQSLGASEAQTKTISYGKERPLCTDHEETCWAQNRRAAVRPPAFASNEQ